MQPAHCFIPLLRRATVQVLLAVALLTTQQLGAQSAPVAAGTPAEQALRTVIAEYSQALARGEPAAVVRLFEADAVAMIQGSAAQTDIDAIRELYAGLFATMAFDLEFHVVEVRVLAPDWALVRTDSHGAVRLRLNGTAVRSFGHEFFLLHRGEADVWRIARYAASSVQ